MYIEPETGNCTLPIKIDLKYISEKFNQSHYCYWIWLPDFHLAV